MRLKRMAVVLLTAGISISAAQAADTQGKGTLRISGSIIESPCSVEAASKEQTIELGQVNSDEIFESKVSKAQKFAIKLFNCPKSTKVRTMFRGQQDSKDETLLALSGGGNTATGAGIIFYAENGKQIPINTKSDLINVVGPDITLEYTTALKGNTATITPGDFNSTATYELYYE